VQIFRRGLHLIGIDKAIIFTVIERVLQAGSGIITLVVVAKCLTKVEQGYYYTFGSILAIQIFFELGLSNIIIQFVAHENASLKWKDSVKFEGSKEAASRLSSLLRFSIKWFATLSIILFIGLLIAGYLFFNKFGKSEEFVNWQSPWIILSITTSLSLMLSPILAFIEGLGRIKEIAKIRALQQIVQIILIFIFFMSGFKLYSSPLAAILAFSIIPTWILFTHRKKMLFFIWDKSDIWKVNYRREIFPYQWKISLSWISGYFIFQLFNPVLFATEGSTVAGQMGMTLAVLNAILMFSLSWISTKVPIFSNYIANKEYDKLDSLFNKTFWQSVFLSILALIVFFIVIFFLRYFDIKIGKIKFGDRFLPFIPMIFMMVPVFVNHIVAALATYLRCHKKEPLLVQSLVMGVLCSLSTLILGNYFGVFGMTLGYMSLTILGAIWVYFIFKSKKKEWHNE
jgi:O-antigen/teichoic acid export membrane protein